MMQAAPISACSGMTYSHWCNLFAHKVSTGTAGGSIHQGVFTIRILWDGIPIARWDMGVEIHVENESTSAPQPQGLTVPVAAGAIIVVLVLSSAVYSVLHYLF